MGEQKLSCCVVRDLLPSYVEELTESETGQLVREHLASCPECSRIEAKMLTQPDIGHAPAPKLGFLRRYRLRQLLSALLAAIVTVAVMCLLYSSEFKYQNTEAGRLAAVEDFVTQDMPAPYSGEEPPRLVTGTPLTVHAWAEQGDSLYLFYTADTEDNIHGFVTLERGINGRYRPLDAIVAPSGKTAGVTGISDTESKTYELAAYNCRGIYSAELSFHVYYDGFIKAASMTVDIDSPDFLKLYSFSELCEKLGVEYDGLDTSAPFSLRSVKLMDEDGNDVTSQYTDESADQSWTGGVGAAETGMVYVFMAIAAVVGIILVRFFLKND